MNFKSLPQLLDYFKDEATGVKYYEAIRWNGNPVCPHCGAEKPYKTIKVTINKKGERIEAKNYKCSNNTCYKKFTVKVGTIFENSKIPFRTWFAAIYLCTAHKKGISSVQLSVDLNITQKTAWFVLHRVREMLKKQAPDMVGGPNNMVEVDEAYVGGKDKNKHTRRKESDTPGIANDGKLYVKKKVVVGIIQRNGKVILKYVPSASIDNMVPFIEQYVPKGSRIISDELPVYTQLKHNFKHEKVNHSLKVYVVGDTHTNTIENFWSVLKRALYGTYHCVSEKHFEAYLNECQARFNTREVNAFQRFENFLTDSEGGILYKNLIAKK